MKNIFKIIEYLPDTQQIVVRYARKNTHKDIDEYPEKVVDCFDLNKNDTEDFIQSLVHKISAHLIEEQDENEGILEENTPIKPTGELDFEKMVGKVFESRLSTRKSRPLKVRRIEL